MEYWERIKALREDRDITQKELAEFLNIAQTHILSMKMEREMCRLRYLSNYADTIRYRRTIFWD